MKMKAAVLYGPGTKYEIEEVELDPPKAGEVMIKLAASGLCHSDEHLVTGDMVLPKEMADAIGWKQFPMIAGHEGSGVVVEVGEGVEDIEVGDHVVTSFVPSCGRCPSCASGHQNLCDAGATLLSGRQVDGTSRHRSARAGDLNLMSALGTFAEYTVVNNLSVIKIPKHIPLEKAALVGCGVTTGWGSAVYAADVQPGEIVVVVGTGGIGMNAVQGAAMAGARYVVAVDPVPWKREAASGFGATHSVASLEEAIPLVNEISWGRNADKVILATDVADGKMIAPLMSMVAKSGTAVITAVANMIASSVELNLSDLTLMQKRIQGTLFGSANPRFDIPRLLHLYDSGRLKLDELVTNTYSLDQLNEGYQDMRDGKNLRGVILY